MYPLTTKPEERFFHSFSILCLELGTLGIVMTGSIDKLEHAAGGRRVETWILVHQVLENGATNTGQGRLEKYFFGHGYFVVSR